MIEPPPAIEAATDQPTDHRSRHALDRLIYFSDAVIAIVITLLVIDLHPPHDLHGDHANLQALANLLPNFFGFFVSFTVIGLFWTQHHAMLGLVRRFDRALVWPNLRFLMAVAFLPFSTAYMSNEGGERLAELIYGGSMMAAGLAKLDLFRVIMHHDLLRHDLPPQAGRQLWRRQWVMPIAGAAATIWAWFDPPFATFGLLIMPISRRLPWFALPAEAEGF